MLKNVIYSCDVKAGFSVQLYFTLLLFLLYYDQIKADLFQTKLYQLQTFER